MLDAFIIEELLQKEREERERAQPELRIDIEPPVAIEDHAIPEESPEPRGVWIIEL